MTNPDAQSSLAVSPTVTITETASGALNRIIAEEALVGIRLSVRSGGCFGVSYTLDFADRVLEQDMALSIGDIQVFIPEFALPYMKDVQIDYDTASEYEDFVITSGHDSYPGGCST